MGEKPNWERPAYQRVNTRHEERYLSQKNRLADEKNPWGEKWGEYLYWN